MKSFQRKDLHLHVMYDTLCDIIREGMQTVHIEVVVDDNGEIEREIKMEIA